MEYDFKVIEKKWRKIWEEQKIFQIDLNSKKEKFYLLDMFPYPSGEGLHVGHPKGYIATDILAHYYRLNNFEVLHPMGWDAFGLPTENFAIKTKKPPAEVTAKNIAAFKKQLEDLSLSYDWSREINTTDPNYYKWTQWIFLQMFKKGLAYQAEMPINFCPSCKTGLANEEVKDGKCERCGSEVERKKLRQWVLKITAYADRLLEDLKDLDWPEPIKLMQSNWIGRSSGTTVKFEIIPHRHSERSEESSEALTLDPSPRQGGVQDDIIQKYIEVFTTRADTLFGCTYIVVSPEKAKEYLALRSPKGEVGGLENEKTKKYIDEALNKLERERRIEEKEKTGIFSGEYAINPVNNKEIPIWIADYVLADYGTGAIMAVPAHDNRDLLFAHKFGLPIKEVIVANSSGVTQNSKLKTKNHNSKVKTAYIDDGILIDSAQFDEMSSEEAREKITQWLKEKKLGDFATSYKLRDWIFSRQRYWGEPIPIVHCEKCGVVPLDEKDLPLKLPEIKNYQPIGSGESPLAAIDDWVNTKCPKCNGPAKRETNTMPQWAGSCWYYIAYIIKNNSSFDIHHSSLIDKWLPVDFYIGGAEHAVLHLLYARFWHKFLYDIGIVKCKEPFQKLRNVGLILAEDGRKMSKSLNNVVSPDDVVNYFGADCFRLYEMFIGPFEESAAWQTKGINGIDRFLKRFWKNIDLIITKPAEKTDPSLTAALEKLIAKITQSIEKMHFNVAIAGLMEFNNLLDDNQKMSRDDLEKLLIVFAPFAPHFCEEIWQKLNHRESIFQANWPQADTIKNKEEKQTIAVQINGKLRGAVEARADASEDEVKKLAEKNKNIKKYLVGEIKKTIYIAGKIINFVVK